MKSDSAMAISWVANEGNLGNSNFTSMRSGLCLLKSQWDFSMMCGQLANEEVNRRAKGALRCFCG